MENQTIELCKYHSNQCKLIRELQSTNNFNLMPSLEGKYCFSNFKECYQYQKIQIEKKFKVRKYLGDLVKTEKLE